MKRLAIANSKGGSGKTTTAVNLAAGLAELLAGRVLLIDLDPAARASKWLANEADPDGRLYDVLADGGDLAELAQPVEMKTGPGFDLIRSSGHLMRAERELIAEPGGAMALAELMRKLPRRRWSVAVFDQPGSASFCQTLGLTAATDILIPIEGAADLEDLPGLKTIIGKVRDRLNRRLRVSAVVQVRCDLRTNLHRDLRHLLAADSMLGSVLSDVIIRANVRLREAPSHGATIFDYDRCSTGAKDYATLAADVAERLELKR